VPTRGTPKADALALAELSANLLGSTVVLHGKAALVNTKTGDTHGWTTGSGSTWSKQTLQLLLELCESMERDIARRDFDSVEGPGAEAAPEGLGEHLSDARQA